MEYPDIKALCLKIGAAPTGKAPNGEDTYTLPVIEDPSTGKVVSDSKRIAEYLDEAYPGTPKLIPPGLAAGVAIAEDFITTNYIFKTFPVVVPSVHLILNPASQGYFQVTREAFLGKSLAELRTPGPARDAGFETIRQGLQKIGEVIDKNGKGSTRFFGEDTFTYADAVLISWLLWPKIVFEPEEWAIIASWEGGRWAKLVEDAAGLIKL